MAYIELSSEERERIGDFIKEKKISKRNIARDICLDELKEYVYGISLSIDKNNGQKKGKKKENDWVNRIKSIERLINKWSSPEPKKVIRASKAGVKRFLDTIGFKYVSLEPFIPDSNQLFFQKSLGIKRYLGEYLYLSDLMIPSVVRIDCNSETGLYSFEQIDTKRAPGYAFKGLVRIFDNTRFLSFEAVLVKEGFSEHCYLMFHIEHIIKPTEDRPYVPGIILTVETDTLALKASVCILIKGIDEKHFSEKAAEICSYLDEAKKNLRFSETAIFLDRQTSNLNKNVEIVRDQRT